MSATCKKDRDKQKRLKLSVEILKALGHPVRLQIVQMLEQGELCVLVFQEYFQLDFSTISRHLLKLTHAGILDFEKRGKFVYYRLKCPCILGIIECLQTAAAT